MSIIRAAAAFLIPMAVVVVAPTPHIPPDMDILGMVRHINTNNNGINQVNNSIIGKMTNINNMTDTTQTIHSHLQTLQAGIGDQDKSLANLKVLSAKQVDLSESLHSLAQSLTGDLSTIYTSSKDQSAMLQKMQDSAATLARLADQLQQTNGTMAAKLDQATSKTAEVNQSMP